MEMGWWDHWHLRVGMPGEEMFAGDQVRTPVTDGGFAEQCIYNLAFYRVGLKPWQRGLGIGIGMEGRSSARCR